MSAYDVINIAFAGAAAFITVINLIILIRNRQGLQEFVVALLSFALFFFYSAMVRSSLFAENADLVMQMFKFRSYLIMIMAILWLIYLQIFFKPSDKAYLIGSLIFMLILIFINLATPVDRMFGLDRAGEFGRGPYGGLIAFGHGFTIWRLLVDLSIVAITAGGSLIMIQGYDKEWRPAFIRLGAGMVIVFLIAFYDHLVDFGFIHFNYLLPYGLFLLLFMAGVEYVNMASREKESINEAVARQKSMQAFLSESQFLIVRLNRMGQVVYANPRFYQVTGYSENEVIGKDWFENFLPKQKSYEVQSVFLQVIEHQFNEFHQNPILCRDGREILIDWYNTRLRGSDGEVYGVISLGVDVTEQMNKITDLEISLEKARNVINNYQEKLGKGDFPA